MLNRDPLARPEQLISRVYAYVAYRVGDGADAEDITSETFELAIRYRKTYDPSKGEPAAWLIGIARRQIARFWASRRLEGDVPDDAAGSTDLQEEAVRRLTVADAVSRLSERDQELIGLRYGADLSTRQIAAMLDTEVNAVDVALHRARGRLAKYLEPKPAGGDTRADSGTCKKRGTSSGTGVSTVEHSQQEASP